MVVLFLLDFCYLSRKTILLLVLYKITIFRVHHKRYSSLSQPFVRLISEWICLENNGACMWKFQCFSKYCTLCNHRQTEQRLKYNRSSLKVLKIFIRTFYRFYLVILPFSIRWGLMKYHIRSYSMTKTQGFRQELYGNDLFLLLFGRDYVGIFRGMTKSLMISSQNTGDFY